MRILMVAARCYPFMGGIETHTREGGPRLLARGHRIGVLTTDPGHRLPVEEDVRGARRIAPDLALPGWNASAQTLSKTYRDVLSSRLMAPLPCGAPAFRAPAEGA